MASKHQKEEQRRITEENEKIKTQIDQSIGIARSIVHSWLPSPKPGEKLSDEEDDLNDPVIASYSTGRPDRLGLGAKFLSHKEAMRHQNGNTNNDTNRPSSKQEMMLKNKILNQNRKALNRDSSKVPVGKRRRPADEDSEESSDEEEESRSSVVGSSNKTKKKGQNFSTLLFKKKK